MFVFDNANSVWSFSYVLEFEDPRLASVRADLPIVQRVLDGADVPVSMEAIAEVLEAVEVVGEGGEVRPARLRARNLVAYLQSSGLTRCINMRGPDTGYVWNHRGISDEEWKRRIAAAPITQTIPAISLAAPEAIPVIVGPRVADRV
jgi:hypothetical protein